MSDTPTTPEAKADALLAALLIDLQTELTAAFRKHPVPPVNGHEVYGNITEERDEFFDLVKADHGCMYNYKKELLHVAVTALRGAAMYDAKRKDGTK